MTRTTFYTATTLDGYIADAHDSLDWLFTQPQDEAGPLNYGAFIADIGAMGMGSTTYEWVVNHQTETGEPWMYEMPSFVFTHRSLPVMDGADVTFVADDVGLVHAAMTAAAGGKDLWVVGGGDLAAQFATAGLLDEVIVFIAPVMLGSGRPLFTRPFDLELVEVARNGAFIAARYAVTGPRAATNGA